MLHDADDAVSFVAA